MIKFYTIVMKHQAEKELMAGLPKPGDEGRLGAIVVEVKIHAREGAFLGA